MPDSKERIWRVFRPPGRWTVLCGLLLLGLAPGVDAASDAGMDAAARQPTSNAAPTGPATRGQPTPAPGDLDAAIRRGRALAAKNCTRCHVVEKINPYGGIGSTPSFKVVLSLDDWLERFKTFFARQPHPVVVRMEGVAPWTKIPSNVVMFDMTADDLTDLVSYVTRLKNQP